MRNWWIYRRVLRKGVWSQEDVGTAYSRAEAERKAALELPYHGETVSRTLIVEVSDTKLIDMESGTVMQKWHGDGHAELVEAMERIQNYPQKAKSEVLSNMAREALERLENHGPRPT